MTNSRTGVLLERRVGAQRPKLLHLPEGIASTDAGGDAIEFAESLGLELDDWQQWLVRLLLAERVDGSLAASTAVILVSRQNGKNVVLATVELYGLCVAGLRRQVHSAHLGDTAAEHMKFLKDLIVDNHLDDEQGGYLHVYEANGKERIVNTETRGELSFNTRTKSTKRGTSPQRIVFDEALYLTDEQTQAMLPSLAAQSMKAETSPQIIATSSAPVAESVTLARMRAQGLAATSPRTLVADWGCEPDFQRFPKTGVDVHDRDNWYSSNPGLGIRISEEFVEHSELLSGTMSEQAFAIERLGVVFGADSENVELAGWKACEDADSHRAAPPKIAVDVAQDLSWSSIGVAAVRADALAHLEVVEHLPGTAATVAVCKALYDKHRTPVHVDKRSETAGLIEDLKKAGVPVVEVESAWMARACSELKRAVAERSVRHRGQGPLDAAVAGAATRTSGDAWFWARRTSSVDISPLVAITIALRALREVVEVKKSGFYFPDLEDE